MEGGGENLGGGGDDPMDVDEPLPAVDPTGPEPPPAPHPHSNPQESSAPFQQSSYRTGPTASTATARARPREMKDSNHVCSARSAVGARTRDVVDLSREDRDLVAGGTGTMQPWSIGARQEQLSKRRALLASLKKVRGPPPATKPPFSGPRALAGATCKLPSVASSTARSVSTTLHSHCQTSSSSSSSSSRQFSLVRSNSNSSSNSARTRSTSTSRHDRDKNSGTAVTTLPETTATTTTTSSSSTSSADHGDPSFATSSQTQLDAQLALAIQLSLQEEDPPPRGTSASSPPPPPSSSMGYESELPSATLRRMRAALLSAHRHRMHRDSDMNEAVMLEQLYFGGAPPGRSSHGSDVTSSFLQAQAEGLTDALGVSSVSEWRAYLLGCGGPVQPSETQNFGIDMSYEALTQLEDVKVGVPEEVLSMLPIFPYVKPEHQQQQEQDSCRCSICLSDFEAGELLTLVGCGHLFHHDCLFPWLKDHKHCPVCKADVTATVWEDPESS